MASANWLSRIFKPSYLLGFLLLFLLTLCSVYVFWQMGIFFPSSPPSKEQLLKQTDWITFFGVMAAIAGWIVNSIVTIRNSIKQHTINALLDSRLSSTYIESARIVNKVFLSAEFLFPVDKNQLKEGSAQAKAMPHLSYMLNYLEFVAVGIRYGDLDELLMKKTLRGMACNLWLVAKDYVIEQRKNVNHPIKKGFIANIWTKVQARITPNHKTLPAKNDLLYEHLEWLANRWHLPHKTRPTKTGGKSNIDPSDIEGKTKLSVSVGSVKRQLTRQAPNVPKKSTQ